LGKRPAAAVTKSVATLVGKAACGRHYDRQNDVRGEIETDRRRKSKRRNEKKEKEKTKTFQQRKSFKTSIDDFLFFTNLFPKKKRKEKREGKG
jgi:hypothetical protein